MVTLKLWVLVLFLLAFSGSGELLITEIMYDPATEMGSDYDLEWVEIYNNGSEPINLSNFTLNTKKILTAASISPNDFVVIAKKLVWEKSVKNQSSENSFESFYGNGDGVWNSLDGNYIAVDAESFSLGNSGGTVVLSNGQMMVKANYSKSLGGDGNGYSLEYVDGKWLESNELYGTPGRKNSANPSPKESNDLKLSVYLPEKVYTYQKYNDLFKLQFLDKKNCSVKDSVKVKYYLIDENNQTILDNTVVKEEVGCSAYAQTGELYFEQEGDYLLCGQVISASVQDFNLDNNQDCREIKVIDTSKIPCDYELSVSSEKMIYAYPETVSFNFKLSSGDSSDFPYTITYWIEDLFSRMVKEKYTSANTNKKSYTPDIAEEDQVVFLKAPVRPVCNDTNNTNNFAEKMLIFTRLGGKSSEAKTSGLADQSEVQIVEAKADSSGMVKAELEIYKGDTSKYLVSAYLEQQGKKISEITKIHLKDKFTTYNLVIPLALKSGIKLKNEEVTLQVEGLGVNKEEDLELEEIPAQLTDLSTSKEEQSSSTPIKLSYNFLSVPLLIYPGEKFTVKLNFNGDKKEHHLAVWSYLYRGSKCYSCCESCEQSLERDGNKLEFDLDPAETKVMALPLNADDGLEAGEYKLKVKIKVDDQVTEKELTETIAVKEEKKEGESCLAVYAPALEEGNGLNKLSLAATEEKTFPESKGVVVYESSSEKAQQLVSGILIVALMLVCVLLVWRK